MVEKREEDVRTLVEGDFNARTGEEEGRKLIDFLEGRR